MNLGVLKDSAYFHQLVRLPRPRSHAFQVDVERRYGINSEEIAFVEHAYSDSYPEENVHPLYEEQIPDAEESLWRSSSELGRTQRFLGGQNSPRQEDSR